MELDQRPAVITGAGSGIGRALALAFARRGCPVVAADIDGDSARATTEQVAAETGVRALAVRCDVTEASDVEALAARAYDELDDVAVLCNNAGVGASTPLHEGDRQWEWVLAVNLHGVLHGITAFVPRMLAGGRPGRVVNTGSEHSLGLPFGGLAAYTASKHAVLGMSDSLRSDLRDTALGVTVLCPGLVRTRIWRSPERRPERFGGAEPAPDELEAMFAPGVEPEAVAELVVEGVEGDEFLVMTHPEVREVAERRHREVTDAFDRLTAANGDA